MNKRYAVKLNKKQVEFINCVNVIENVKKTRALNSGVSHPGITRYVVSSDGFGKKTHHSTKDCA